MNSRERVFAALERQEPDRVPVVEWVIDPHVMEGIYPGSTYLEFVDRMGLDAAGPNTAYDFQTGMDWVDRDKRILRDKWGVIRQFTSEVVAYPLQGPIKTLADARAYKPPDPQAEGALGILPQVVERFKGKKAIIWFGHDAFINPCYLHGMDNVLRDYALDPDLSRALVEISVEFEAEMARRAIKAGAEIVVLGDDYAWKKGPLMSPAHFEEFILPGLQQVVKATKDEGGFCVKHTDGNIYPILDMIVDTGIDAINPLEPVAGMDIADVKRRYGDRVCVVGNIDCGELLSRRYASALLRPPPVEGTSFPPATASTPP
jgi:uroporphyrinogen decarboxylase